MITLLLLVRATYMYGGESHIQRNTTGEVATPPTTALHLQTPTLDSLAYWCR